LTSGWEVRALGDLFDITSSKRVFEADWKREGVPFYRAREIVKLAHQGFVQNELFISEEMFNRYSTKYGVPVAGDIMVTGVGTLGICYVVKDHDRFYFKDGNILWLKKRSDVSSRYVEYAFKSDFLRRQIDDGLGATVGTFTIIKAKSTLIPVPPPLEQDRIVAILDEAFAAIATARSNTEWNLRNATELFKSHLDDVFRHRGPGWVEGRLDDLATFTSGLWKGEKPPYVHVGVIRNTNFTKDGRLDDTDIAFLDVEVRQFEKRRLQPGDIILEKSGGGPKQAVGRVVIFDKTSGDFSLSNFTSAIRIKDPSGLDARYLHLYLHWLYLSGATESMQSHSTGIRNLNGEAYKAVTVPYPNRDEQVRVAGVLGQVFRETRRLDDLVNRKVAALDALKQSLLYQAFTGAL
jgi:type I restriction enzyme, S subunit